MPKTIKKVKTNKVKSKTRKKKTTRKRKKKVSMDEVYKILNKVQLDKKKMIFAMFVEDSETAEHIIKDLDLEYDKKVMKTQVVFTVYPRENDELEILEIDYLDDEIPEEGQIFG